MSPRVSASAVGFSACLALVASPGRAGGAEQIGGVSAVDASVEVIVVGNQGDLRWVRGLLGAGRSSAASTRWRLAERFDPRELLAAPAQAGALVCWLDLSDDRRGRFYFAAPSGQHFLLRDVELSGQKTELDRAALAEVLELSVAALLENERLGLTRAETETLLSDRRRAESASIGAASRPATRTPDSGAAAALSSPAARLRWALGVRFAEQILSSDFPLAERAGLEAVVGRGVGAGWLAAVLATEYQFPCTALGPDVGVQLQTLAMHGALEAGFEHADPGTAPFGWRAAFGRLGAGIDFDRIAPRPGTQALPVSLTSPHWSSSLVLRPSVGSAWTIAARAALEVVLFADVRPIAVHYDLSAGSETRAVYSPWRVRPGLALVVALH